MAQSAVNPQGGGAGAASQPSGAGHALIIVDVQNDFVDGSLATERGAQAAEAISKHIAGLHRYDVIVGTKDWHIDPAGHFAPEGTEPDYQDTWPVHCVAGTTGAQSHPALATDQVEAWFHKGEYEPAYSGFEGHLADSLAAAEAKSAAAEEARPKVLLAEWLRSRRIGQVTVVGIATDFCVRATALDAKAEGFDVNVIPRLCAPVSAAGEEATLAELREAGIEVK